jgi:hypothetical protein
MRGESARDESTWHGTSAIRLEVNKDRGVRRGGNDALQHNDSFNPTALSLTLILLLQTIISEAHKPQE